MKVKVDIHRHIYEGHHWANETVTEIVTYATAHQVNTGNKSRKKSTGWQSSR